METPHDHLFRSVFAEPARLSALFRSALTVAEAAALDWDATAPVPGEFFDDRLAAFRLDLLFRTDLAGDPACAVYLLAEHKSWHDAGTARKLLRYGDLVRQRHAALHPGSPEAIVIPLVVHHGRRPWHPDEDRRRRRQSSAPPTLVRFLPWHQILLLDLARLDEAAMRALPMPPLGTLTLLCLQFLPGRRSRVIEACLRRWQDLLVQVHARDPGHGPGALSSYILFTTEMPADRLGRLLGELIGPEPEENLMFTAEKLIQKGRKQGRAEGRAEGQAEGRAEGRAELLLRQLAARFGTIPADTEQRVRKADPADLDRWAIAVLTCKTLEQVFAA